MSQEQRDSYVIPPNFIEGGSFFGGLFKARNVVEAVILAAGKTDKSVLKKLKKLSETALQQINDKKYETELTTAGVRTIYKYGVAFSGKKIEVAVG